MQHERLFVYGNLHSIEVRDDAEKLQRFVGHASVYYDGTPGTEYRVRNVVERIMPGAFDRAIHDDVVGLFNHDPNYVLGRTSSGTMTLEADGKGLRYEIMPAQDSTRHRDLMVDIKRGDVTGASFGFIPGDTSVAREGDTTVKYIRSVKMLRDVGPVTFPAYSGASAMMRSKEYDEMLLREAEEFQRKQREEEALRLRRKRRMLLMGL
jgi:HK97 family phage prohead protease